ncbi:MAG: hypothetical protein ACLTER_05790 [Ruminococcus sp.]
MRQIIWLKIKIQPDTLLACLNKTVEKLRTKCPGIGKPKKGSGRGYNKAAAGIFQKDVKLSDFMGQHSKTRLAFMEASCAVCYVTFEKYLS